MAEKIEAYNVYIDDTFTHEVRTYRMDSPWEEWSDFLWRDGNFSCDCNRHLFFARAANPDTDFDDVECGDGRFRVVITDDNGNELYRDDAA